MLGKLISISKSGEEKGELPVINLHFFIGSDLFCDLRIKHKEIAAQHCLITSQRDKPALIRNLSRTVPTLVNNTEIGTTDVELKDQDVIAIRHKLYKWCYNDSSKPSTSSQTSFAASSKQRKSWPLFKNKLVAVVTPQRRDEDIQVTENIQLGMLQREVPPKKRRGTVGGELQPLKKVTSPKVLAVKVGLKTTLKRSFGKRKSNLKTSQQTTPVVSTSQKLPPSNRKSVKFLDSAPRSRLGKRGRKSSLASPYRRTPARQKISLYTTPPSTFGHNKLKGILKTPGNSSSTSAKKKCDKNLSHLAVPSIIIGTPDNLASSSVSDTSGNGNHVVPMDDLLRTPPKAEQPEVVMRSSRRKAVVVRSPPSTPKSAIKRKKSLEEKAILSSERASKKLKKTPHLIEEKRRAAILKCHRKSLTPYPEARKCGKIITKFPSSFNSRLKTPSPLKTKPMTELSKTGKSDSMKFSTSIPKVFRFSSLGESSCSEQYPSHNTESSQGEEVQQKTKKSFNKSASKMLSTSPIKKFTRASRAARASRELQRRENVDDVLSALDLSRRWPPPSTSANTSSQVDVSNLSGIKKLFCTDKTLDAKEVRELFLESTSESDPIDQSLLSFPGDHSERTSRHSTQSKASIFNDKDESGLINSFYSEGAQEQLCSESILSANFSSFPSYSSTSRRSLSLKRGRKSTLSPNNVTSLLQVDKTPEEEPFLGIEETVTSSGTRRGRRSRTILSSSTNEHVRAEESPKLETCNIISKSGKTRKSGAGNISLYSTPLTDKQSTSYSSNSNSPLNQIDSDNSHSDISVFSLGSLNASRHKSRSSDSLSLLDESDDSVDEGRSRRSKRSNSLSPVQVAKQSCATRSHSKKDISLRRVVLMASTPKSEKKQLGNKTSLRTEMEPLETTIRETSSLLVSSTSGFQLDISEPHSHNSSESYTLGQLHKLDLDQVERMSPIKITPKQDISQSNQREKSLKQSITTPQHVETVLLSNKSSGKRGRSSKVSLIKTEETQSASILPDKKRSRSLPSTECDGITFNNINEQSTSKSTGRKGRPLKISVVNETQLDSSERSVSRSLIKLSIKDDKTTPKILESISLNSQLSGKRGRPSKLNFSEEETQLEFSRSPVNNLPKIPSSGENTTPTNTVVPSTFQSTGRKGRPLKVSVVNNTQLDSSPIALTNRSLSSSTFEDNKTTPKLVETISLESKRSGKRGRLSKLNLSQEETQLELSSPVKKRSRSLPATKSDDTTPKNTKIQSNSKSTGRRGRPTKGSVVNETMLASSYKSVSSSINQLSAIDDDTTPESTSLPSPSKSTGRRGRPTKVSVAADTQLNLSTSLTVGSLSTSTIEDDNTTPKTVEIYTRDTKNSGKRGRPSKLNLTKKETQSELSPSVKKRSCSLPATESDNTTPKNTIGQSTSKSTGRRGRPPKVSVVNKTQLESSARSVSKFLNRLSVGDDTNPESTLRNGRPPKGIVVNETQLDSSTKSLNRLSAIDDDTTPQTTSLPSSSKSTAKIGRPTKVRDVTDTQLNTSSISLTVGSLCSSSIEDNKTTPKTVEIFTQDTKNSGKRGRQSKLNLTEEETQSESSSSVNKRSHSLPSTECDHTTPKNTIVQSNSKSTGRRGRPTKGSVVNETHLDSSARSLNWLSVRDDDAMPEITLLPSPSKSTERKGRTPKVSVVNETQLDSSARSLNRISAIDGDTIPENTLLPSPKSTGRRGRPTKGSVVNETRLDSTDRSVSRAIYQLTAIDDDTTPKNTTLQSNSKSTGRRGRPPKVSVINQTQLDSSTRTLNWLSVGDDDTTPKSTLIPSPSTSTGRRGRPPKVSVINETHLDSSARSLNRLSVGDDDATPETTLLPFHLKSTEKKGRTPKVSVVNEAHLDLSARSLNQISAIDGDTTPENALLPSPKSTGRRSRPTKVSVVTATQLNSSSTSLTVGSLSTSTIEDDKTTPKTVEIFTQDTKNSGKRGRQSKLDLIEEETRSELSSLVNKRSHSLPSTECDHTTPKNTIVQSNSKSTGRRGRPPKISVINETHLDSSARSLNRLSVGDHDETPETTLLPSPSKITGRKGRTPKVSVVNEKQLDSSARSLNRISAIDGDTTPENTLLPSPKSTGRRGRPTKVSVVTATQLNSSSTSLTVGSLSTSTIEDNKTTPKTIEIFTQDAKNSGKRGRQSKLNLTEEETQSESSSSVNKRSHSLPSTERDHTIPKNTIVQSNSKSTGRRGRSPKDGDVNETQLDSPARSLSRLFVGDDDTTPVNTLLPSPSKGTGRKDRTPKVSVVNETQLDSSARSVSRARNRLSGIDDGTTPECTLLPSPSERNDRPTKVSVVTDTLLNSSPISLTVGSPSSSPVKKHSCSLPATESDGTTPKNTIIQSSSKSTGRRGRPTKGSVVNETRLDSTDRSVSRSIYQLTAIDDDTTPKNTTLQSNSKSTGRRGRPPKVSVINQTQLDSSTRTLNWLSVGDDDTTPKSTLIPSPSKSTGRKGRPTKVSVVIDTQLNSSSTSLTVGSLSSSSIENDKTTPKIVEIFTLDTKNSGKQGRPSKLNLTKEEPQLEVAPQDKKHSHSLPSTESDDTTPKNTLVPSTSKITSRRGRPPKISVINETQVDLSAISVSRSPNQLSVRDDKTTPNISEIVPLDCMSSRKRGRPKLILSNEETQSKLSPFNVKNHFLSLPSSKVDSETPTSTIQASIPVLSPVVTEKSRKHKTSPEASRISCKVNSKSFNSFVHDNSLRSLSPIKKRLRSEDSSTTLCQSDKVITLNKSTSKNLQIYNSHSSTPVVPQSSSIFFSSGIRNLSRFKSGAIQSRVQISPIVGSDESSTSAYDHSEVSVICLPSPKSLSDFEISNISASNPSFNSYMSNDHLSSFSSHKKLFTTKNTVSPKTRNSKLKMNLKGSLADLSYENKANTEASVKVSRSSNSVLDKISRNESDKLSKNSLISIVSDKSVTESTNKLPLQGHQSLRSHEGDKTNVIQSTNKSKLEISTKNLPTGRNEEFVCEISDVQKSERFQQNNTTGATPIIKLTSSKSRTKKSKILKKDRQNTIPVKSPLKVKKGRKAKLEGLTIPSVGNIAIRAGRHAKQADDLSFQDVPIKKKVGRKTLKIEEPTDSSDKLLVLTPELEKESGGAEIASCDRIMVHSSSTVTTRPIDKISPFIPRRGRSAKENTLNLSLEKHKDDSSMQNTILTKKRGRKNIVGQTFKTNEVNSILIEDKSHNLTAKERMVGHTAQDKPLEEKSPIISVSKTRSRRTVVALKTSNKGRHISSPIVKSPHLRRGRPTKIDSETQKSVKTSPLTKRRGRPPTDTILSNLSLEKHNANSTSQDISVTKRRGRPTKIDSETQKSVKTSPLTKRRGRPPTDTILSNLSLEKHNANSTSQDISVTKRRGRPTKIDSETQKSVTTSPLIKRRGRPPKDTTLSNLSLEKHNPSQTNSSPQNISVTKRKGRKTIAVQNPIIINGSNEVKVDRPVGEGKRKKEIVLEKSQEIKERTVTKVKEETGLQDSEQKSLTISVPVQRRGRSVVKARSNTVKEEEAEPVPQATQRRGRATLRNQTDLPSSPPAQKRGRRAVKGEKENHIKDEHAKFVEKPAVQRRGRSAIIKEETNSSSPKRGANQLSIYTKNGSENQNLTLGSPPSQKRGRPVVTVQKNNDTSPKKLVKQGEEERIESPAGRRGKKRQAAVIASKPPRRGKQASSPVAVSEPLNSTKSACELTANKSGHNKSAEKSSSEINSLNVKRKTRNVKRISSNNEQNISGGRRKSGRQQLLSEESVARKLPKVSEQSKAIKSSKNINDKKPLKSAIKKVLRMSHSGTRVRRFSRKSSIMGFTKIEKKIVHFNLANNLYLTPDSSVIINKKKKTSNKKEKKEKNIRK